MSTISATGETRGRRRVALIASLCFNALLLGVIIMGSLRVMQARNDPASLGGALAPTAIVGSLPHAEREHARKIVESHREKLLNLRNEAFDRRGEVIDALRAPRYSRQVFESTLKRVRDADNAVADELGATIADAIATLTPDERKVLADRAQRRFRFVERHRR